MRKFFAVFVLGVVLSSASVFAQFGPNPNFKNKDMFIGAHLGLGGGSYTGIGPVLNFEYGVLPQLGVTANVGFFGYSQAFSTYSYSYTQIPIAAGVNYHVDLLKVNKLDTWAGASIVYVVGSWSSSDAAFASALSTYTSSYITWDFHVGGRYFFSDKLAAKVELGYWSLGYLRVGVDFKL
jgi:hypothetical protein